jgi:hypothetical protein
VPGPQIDVVRGTGGDREEEVPETLESNLRVQVPRHKLDIGLIARMTRQPGCHQTQLQWGTKTGGIRGTALVLHEARQLPAAYDLHVLHIFDALLPPSAVNLFAREQRSIGARVWKCRLMLGKGRLLEREVGGDVPLGVDGQPMQITVVHVVTRLSEDPGRRYHLVVVETGQQILPEAPSKDCVEGVIRKVFCPGDDQADAAPVRPLEQCVRKV